MRCPYCGSDQLRSTTKRDGYSVKKGLAGAIILGPVGAVAGIDGKKKQVYHCPVCGEDAPEPMPTATSMEIFNAILKRDESKLRALKSRYRNIEWNESLASSGSKRYASSSSTMSAGTQIQGTGDLKKDLRDYFNQINAPLNYDDIEGHFLALAYTQEKIQRGLLDSLEEGMVKHVNGYYVLVRDIDEMMRLKECGKETREEVEKKYVAERLAKETERLAKEKKQKEKEQEKKRALDVKIQKAYISEIEKQLAECEKEQAAIEENFKVAKQLHSSAIEERGAKISKNMAELQDALDALGLQLQNKEITINNKQTLSEQLVSEMNSLSFLQRGKKKTLEESLHKLSDEISAMLKEAESIKDEINKTKAELEGAEATVDSEIKKLAEIETSMNMSLQLISAARQDLLDKIDSANKGIIPKEDEGRIKRELTLEQLEVQRDKENEKIKWRLIKMLAMRGAPMTVSQLMREDSELSEHTPQRITSLLRQAVHENKVKKCVIRGETHFHHIG